MEDQKKILVKEQNEIPLKDLVLKIQDWGRFLLSRWLVIMLFGITGAGLGYALSVSREPDYVGELTFVLEDGKSSTLSGLGGLASQFGLDLGGGSSVGVFSGDNILEFLKSRLMVEKTLLSTVQVGNKKTNLISLYITSSKLKFPKIPPARLAKFFPLEYNRATFSREEDSVLDVTYQTIIKSNLTVAKPDKKTGFINVKCISKNEYFSKLFIETLVREATDFYVQTKTKRSKVNVDMLQQKADSLEALLNKRTYSAAMSQDINLNPVRRVASVGTEVINRDKMILQTVYGEVLKNLELSKMSMAQETPVIQIIDGPILPLQKQKLGKLKGIIMGGFIAAFLCIFVIFIRKIYRDVMS